MDKLWAPWRLKYVTSVDKTRACVFCKIQRQKKDKKNFIFLRSKHSFAVLNIYPYNNGHSLIVPNRHVKDIGKLKRDEREDLLDRVMMPPGYNIGINLGRIAGAGYPGHVHIHIVPRWSGDVNFMPVVGNTKVISQSLTELYNTLLKNKKKSKKKA